MTTFEKSGKGQASAGGTRKKSHIKTAEQMVEESSHAPGPARSMPDRAMQDHIQHSAEYKAKSRAEYLMSMDVVKGHSPSERLAIKDDPSSPFGHRWCSESRRQHHGAGMDGWDPITSMEEAKKLCPHQHLREEGGKIFSGDVFLCRRPREVNEGRAALAYQKSQRMMNAAAQGVAGAQKVSAGGESSVSESFSDIERSTASAEDPGVRASAKLRISEPGG